jgi:hypothetical protein
MRPILAVALLAAMAAGAAAETLRIRTCVRVPDDIIRQFRQETGVDVRLMATIEEPLTPRPGGRPGVDLFQLSPNDPAGPKRIVAAYKPLDLSRIRTDRFIPSLWEGDQAQDDVRRQGLRRSGVLGNRRPGGERGGRAEARRLSGSVRPGSRRQDRPVRRLCDAGLLRLFRRPGPFRGLWGPRGLCGDHGQGRRGTRAMQEAREALYGSA